MSCTMDVAQNEPTFDQPMVWLKTVRNEGGN